MYFQHSIQEVQQEDCSDYETFGDSVNCQFDYS